MSAFGQADDRATPLQMAMVSSAIANGGKVMAPNLVESIVQPNLQPVETFTPTVLGTATSAATANTISQMMVNDVQNGIITNARIDGVSVAGKTGTAQNGSTQPYSLWFTGFAPANNPQYAVAVVVENGGGQGQSGSGNSIAAPIARQVLEAVLNK
jgi:peptidoglycan glycosyltransferase